MALDEEMLGVSKDYVVTETAINVVVPSGDLIEFLLARKTTGQLIFHLTQGSIQKISVNEKTKVTLEDEAES